MVYLREGGSGIGGANCTKGSPCGQLDTAIEQSSMVRPYIRVTGTIEGSNEDVTGKTVTFLGSPNAAFRGSQSGGSGGGDEPILELRGASNVTIYDLILRDGRRPGIRVDEGSSVTLHRSKVQNCVDEGVLVSDGKATIATQTEIIGNGGITRRGVNLSFGELVVERSKIADNAGGGVIIADNQKFTITSSFITGNRVGGGLVAQLPGAGSKFEFNTVADNDDTGTGVADAGGIFCDSASFVFANNIIYRNTGGSGGFVQTVGDCTYGNSLLSPNNAAEIRSLELVKDTPPRDYHLTTSSPVIVKDVASCTAATGFVDYDGEPRPQGSSCELGADEIKQ